LSVQREGENMEEELLKYQNREENTRELSMYFRNIAIDTRTGNLYCYVKKNQAEQQQRSSLSSEKKKRRSGSYDLITKKKKKKKRKRKNDEDDEDENRQEEEEADEEEKSSNSNRLRIMHMSSRCRTRPLKKFNALGHIITTEKDGPSFLCPHCGAFSIYARKNIRDSNGEISCGCMQHDFQLSLQCELCHRMTRDKVYLRWICDEEKDPMLRRIAICSRHKLYQIKKYKGIMLLSTLKQAVENNEVLHTLSDGTQFFVAPILSSK